MSVRVVSDPVALSTARFGWSGAFGTHFWVDPKEKLVTTLMTQTSTPGFIVDFENGVMQASWNLPRAVS